MVLSLAERQAFDNHTSAFYASDEFNAKNSEFSQFLTDIKPFMDGRPVTLENMVYSYIVTSDSHDWPRHTVYLMQWNVSMIFRWSLFPQSLTQCITRSSTTWTYNRSITRRLQTHSPSNTSTLLATSRIGTNITSSATRHSTGLETVHLMSIYQSNRIANQML